jgi:serine protease Do
LKNFCQKFSLFIVLIFFSTVSIVFGDLQQEVLAARNKVMPALVHIEPVRKIFSTGESRHALVTGSGFIFSPEGYILTNHHVVENAEKLTCTLSNKKKLPAEIIGSDPYTDVAVIRLDMQEWGKAPLPFVNLGDSDSLEVGQFVLALGSPLGLSRSVSMGVVSSIDRYFEDQGQMLSPYNLWIQTDAAINPGNSGGPLINLEGKVVGINARGVFMAENLGFAIPINLAREVSQKLMANKKISRSWIGIELQPIKDLRDYLHKPDLAGALVSNVDSQSPADKAGLKAGDVLLSVNNLKINAEFEEDLPAIRKIISDLPAFKEVQLTMLRDGKKQNLRITPEPEPFQEQPEFDCENWGLVVKSINQSVYRIQNLPDYNGVLVAAVKSGDPAERAGLRAGDVIRSVNQEQIKNLDSFKEIYQKLIDADTKTIFFETLRQGAPYYAVIGPEEERD